MIAKLFGDKLKKLREFYGVSQADLATELEVSQTNISYWERTNKKPDDEMIKKIAKALSVASDYFDATDVIEDNVEKSSKYINSYLQTIADEKPNLSKQSSPAAHQNQSDTLSNEEMKILKKLLKSFDSKKILGKNDE